MTGISTLARGAIAALLLGSPLLASADDAGRRYLNQVFDEHIRTGDIEFA